MALQFNPYPLEPYLNKIKSEQENRAMIPNAVAGAVSQGLQGYMQGQELRRQRELQDLQRRKLLQDMENERLANEPLPPFGIRPEFEPQYPMNKPGGVGSWEDQFSRYKQSELMAPRNADEAMKWLSGLKPQQQTRGLEFLKSYGQINKDLTGKSGDAPSGYRWTQRGTLEPIPGGPGDPKNQKPLGFQEELRLRQEFINRPEVKDYQVVSTQVKSMDALLNKALSGDSRSQLAIDQALITMFNKLTDPASVVRESEYARTPENLPMVNRMVGSIEKIKQGGAGLTNEDRSALVEGAKVIMNERGGQFQNSRNEYTKLAEIYGMDPNRVTGTISGYTPYGSSSQPMQMRKSATNPQTGEKLYSDDGGLTWHK